MIIATETPNLRAPMDWQHLPAPTIRVWTRADDLALQELLAVDTLGRWDGAGEPPVGGAL